MIYQNRLTIDLCNFNNARTLNSFEEVIYTNYTKICLYDSTFFHIFVGFLSILKFTIFKINNFFLMKGS